MRKNGWGCAARYGYVNRQTGDETRASTELSRMSRVTDRRDLDLKRQIALPLGRIGRIIHLAKGNYPMLKMKEELK